ncbi:MAG: DUF4032 domain-containing protein, partial [Acidimicrobiia bacterium]
MPDFTITVRPGHPDFLDLDWARSVEEWDSPRLVELPRGISRHVVRFVSYRQGIYAIKELPTALAHRDYEVLRGLESKGAPAVMSVGLVDSRIADPTAEMAAALITRYEDFSFSFRELLEGPGFGQRRNQMLDAFASLLVELHTTGCFWGDCSLSNTLCRFDAESIETIMVDAETAAMFETLTDGQREEDLDIMIINVAGGMADIAAERGIALDDADLALGEDIAARYRGLWAELTDTPTIGSDERYLIADRVKRLNDLGFDVQEIDLQPSEGGQRLQITVRVGGRTYHRVKLKELTGVEALENQARQILDDLFYFQAKDHREEPNLKALT